MIRKRLPPRISAALAQALPALALALAATVTPAAAQVFVRPFYYSESWSGPLVRPLPDASDRMPMGELFEDLRDQGYRPVGVIARNRDTVTVEAIDGRDRRLRLTVDAYDGEIINRRIISAARAEPPRSPYVRPVPNMPETAPSPPKRRIEGPSTSQRRTPAPEATNPDAPPPKGPVAPARDPSQWGKQG